MFGGPRLGHQHRARRPFRPQADADHRAPEDQRRQVPAQRRAGRCDAVNRHRPEQRLRAAHAVRKNPESDAANGGERERERADQPRLRRRQMKLPAQRVDRENEEQHVHGVEHVAGLRGKEREPLLAGDFLGRRGRRARR